MVEHAREKWWGTRFFRRMLSRGARWARSVRSQSRDSTHAGVRSPVAMQALEKGRRAGFFRRMASRGACARASRSTARSKRSKSGEERDFFDAWSSKRAKSGEEREFFDACFRE